MWVAEDRVEEYRAAGHKLVAQPTPTEEKKVEDAKVVKPVRRKK